MDFNDIKLRIKRIYASVKAIFDDDVSRHFGAERAIQGKYLVIKTHLNQVQKEEDLANNAMMPIHNLAHLKDHLKDVLKKRGDDPSVIEKEIKNSFPLQVIIDLSNPDKHQYPAQRDWSGKKPQIKNIQNVFHFNSKKDGEGAFISMDLSGNHLKTKNASVIISADIIDDKNNVIFSLDDLLNQGLAAWENIIDKYNLNK